MEQALAALGGLVLKALPTLILVVLLHFYLRAMLYGPLEKVLKQRAEATAGVRKLAEESRVRAETRTKEYEDALRNARGEIYREQEAMRRAWRDEQSKAVAEARARANEHSAEARRAIQEEAETARLTLEARADALAEQIAGAVLRRSNA